MIKKQEANIPFGLFVSCCRFLEHISWVALAGKDLFIAEVTVFK